MNYGVVLPIWQLTIAEAESLALKAEELGLDGVFVPDHILAKPATTQHYGGAPGESSSAPASSCCPIAPPS